MLASISAVLVAVVILIAVIHWFNWERYRSEIADWIGSSIARTVSIDGNVDVKLLPYLHFSLSGVSISNTERDSTGPLLYVENVNAKLNFVALFVGKVVFEKLHLDQSKVRFEINRAGKSNWRFTENDLNRLASKTRL